MILMLDTVIKTNYRNLFVLIFLAVAIAIVLISYEFHEILAVDSFGENQSAVTAERQAPAFTIETLEKYVAFLAGIAEIAEVHLLILLPFSSFYQTPA
jgi:hypothetical protein